ncbi:Uncharacterised protein [Halioglobus japonicus]|nr:Uncharacterised protein [Halioglobus japonicus]
MRKQRIMTIEPPYPQSVQASFDTVMPQGIPPLNIFKTVANNKRVLSRMVNGGLLDKGSISIRQRELVILRACANCKAEYEWGVHVAVFSAKAGFTQEQIADTCNSPIDTGHWSSEERVLIRLVDELHHSAQLSDQAWMDLCEYFTHEQIVELVMLAGLYHAVSFVVNALKVEHEEFAPRFHKPKNGENLPIT